MGVEVVTLHTPFSSLVIGKPAGPPPTPIGMTSAMSLLTTLTVVASGAQTRNVTRRSDNCSTALNAAGPGKAKPRDMQVVGAAGVCAFATTPAATSTTPTM